MVIGKRVYPCERGEAIHKNNVIASNVVARRYIPCYNSAFLCLISAKRRFVVKKTTFFESKNHLFLMKKGGFFIIETKSGRNQKPFGRIIIENGLLRFSLAMREFLRLARNKVASHDNRWKLAVTKKEGS